MENIFGTKRQDAVDRAVAYVLSFFDIFDHPLDLHQLWRFLPEKADILEVKESLFRFIELRKVSFNGAMFYLKGREAILCEREERYIASSRKKKRALAVAKIFRIFPGVVDVLLVNMIGGNNLREGSDIDLLVICRPGTIWRSRLFCAGLMKLLNLRPREGDKRDKICLSFYISSDRLNMQDLVIPGGDPYFYYWMLGATPLFNDGKFGFSFYQSNSWLFLKFPNFFPFSPENSGIFNSLSQKKKLSFFERLVRNFQLMIMSNDLKQAAIDKQAVISDDLLKLFLVDKRPEFLSIHKSRMRDFFGYEYF